MSNGPCLCGDTECPWCGGYFAIPVCDVCGEEGFYGLCPKCEAEYEEWKEWNEHEAG